MTVRHRTLMTELSLGEVLFQSFVLILQKLKEDLSHYQKVYTGS